MALLDSNTRCGSGVLRDNARRTLHEIQLETGGVRSPNDVVVLLVLAV